MPIMNYRDGVNKTISFDDIEKADKMNCTADDKASIEIK